MQTYVKIMKLLFVALVLSFVNISVTFSADCVVQDSQNKIQKMGIEEKIEYLQKQINELKKLLKKERQNRKKSAQIICGKEKDNIKVKFGGQYRINFYSARNEKNNVQGDHDDQRAARLRIKRGSILIQL